MENQEEQVLHVVRPLRRSKGRKVFGFVIFSLVVVLYAGLMFWTFSRDSRVEAQMREAALVVGQSANFDAEGKLGHGENFAYAKDGVFVRYESFLNGAHKSTLLSHPDTGLGYMEAGGSVQMLPAIERQADLAQHSNSIQYAYEHATNTWPEIRLPWLSGSTRFDSEELEGPDDGYRYFRRVRLSGLHDHHAYAIEIVRIDAETKWPVATWEAKFSEVLRAEDRPVIVSVDVMKVTFPELSSSPEMRSLDPNNPVVLFEKPAEMFPSWLRPEWSDPVLSNH